MIRKFLTNILPSVIIGFVFGLIVQRFLTGEKFAPLVCAIAAGIAVTARQRTRLAKKHLENKA